MRIYQENYIATLRKVQRIIVLVEYKFIECKLTAITWSASKHLSHYLQNKHSN